MRVEFSSIVGKTFNKVEINKEENEIHFHTDTQLFTLYHEQDCYEHVYIESITGNIEKHLPNNEVLEAYESYSKGNPQDDPDYPYHDDSCTWSFYTIRTMYDTFTIRFFGSSNGWYSEDAALHVYEYSTW